MKTLEKIFLKMSGREQSLLVVSLWVVFLLCFLQVIQISFQAYTDWKLNEETINGHRMILGLKPASDSEKTSARRIAFLASRTNTMLSIPMLFLMTNGLSHKGLIGL